MSTTKVLHVIARMNVGGTAQYVSELVKNIPNSFLATGYIQGAEVEDPAVLTLDAYRLPHMGRKISPVNDFKAWLELRKLIKQLKPEIIHTHTFKAGLIGRLIGGEHKQVHTFHGHLFGDQSFSSLEKRVITLVEIYLAKRTEVLISVGERVGVELRAAGIGKGRPWVSIPPGVNKLIKLDKAKLRTSSGLDSNLFIVGWMARMTGVKNPMLMLEVAELMPEIKFLMAGGGELLEVVKLTAPKNVSVLGWKDAAEFWSMVDCAISTSDNEGMPVALIEAQLSGIPVIATNVGSNSEVIENGVTGIVVTQDALSIVSALKSLIISSTLFESMSAAAAEASLRKFNIDRLILAHSNIYRNWGKKPLDLL